MSTELERDAIRLYSTPGSIYTESWSKQSDVVRRRFRDFAADVRVVHGVVGGVCVCGEVDCRVMDDIRAMDEKPIRRVGK